MEALIERQGLQYLVDVAAAVLHNPLFINDMSGKVLAKSSSEESAEVWKNLLPGEYMDSDKLRMAEDKGVIRKIAAGDEPVLDTFPYSPYRFLGCRIRDKDGAVGIATIVEKNPFQDGDDELLIIICKAAFFEMLYLERTAMQKIPYYSLFKDILEENIDDVEIRERCQVMHLIFPKNMRLIGVRFSETHQNSLSLFYIRELLMTALPSSFCIVYDDSLVVVADDEKVNRSYIGQIQNVFADKEIRIGVSRKFTGIKNLRHAFGEMKAIQSVYAKLDIEKPLTYYDDIQLYHFMQIASRDNDLEEFCASVVRDIKAYDQANKTQYLEAIETYLEMGRNRQMAAEYLKIHKNTMYYRLSRAEELFDIDLSNENVCFNLQFSLRMLRMIK